MKTSQSQLPLRPALVGIEAYGAPQLEVSARLNVNENPYSPSPQVVASITQAVTEAAQGINRYPDRDFSELRRGLSKYLEKESRVYIDPEQIWAGNGSNEVMLHIFQAFGGPGRVAASFTPTYSMYSEYARDTLTDWVTRQRHLDFSFTLAEVGELFAQCHPAILLLASPNNPTGTSLPIENIEAICEQARGSGPAGTDCVVVIDEAYAEFRRTGTPSALELLSKYPHLAVSRTMSKAFAMAGLRLGYLAGSPELIAALKVVRLPYHLSALTQAGALAALSHHESLMEQVASLRVERDNLVSYLRSVGLEAVDSDANFVLFGKFKDRQRVFSQLLDKGVLIRVVGPEGYLRVTVGTPAETAAFCQALASVREQIGE